MIHATEALSIPTAILSSEEKKIVADLIAKIDAHVRKNMRYSGTVMNFPGLPKELATPISHVLEENGYQSQWLDVPTRHALTGTETIVPTLFLCPTRESYKAAGCIAETSMVKVN